MGRKRNQGKARRAAKAKAKEEEEERKQANDDEYQRPLPLEEHYQRMKNKLQIDDSGSDSGKCSHGANHLSMNGLCFQFARAFHESFQDTDATGLSRLISAHKATLDEFADVWCDAAKMKYAISCFLRIGTQEILDGHNDNARDCVMMARYFEEHVATELHRTRPHAQWHKMHVADLHTIVKFFRHRIPCTCLDEKYDEVKCIAKMGLCFNSDCSSLQVERSKTMYCTRCRNALYCSRECQVADYTKHKPLCESMAKTIAEFKARQQK